MRVSPKEKKIILTKFNKLDDIKKNNYISFCLKLLTKGTYAIGSYGYTYHLEILKITGITNAQIEALNTTIESLDIKPVAVVKKAKTNRKGKVQRDINHIPTDDELQEERAEFMRALKKQEASKGKQVNMM